MSTPIRCPKCGMERAWVAVTAELPCTPMRNADGTFEGLALGHCSRGEAVIRREGSYTLECLATTCRHVWEEPAFVKLRPTREELRRRQKSLWVTASAGVLLNQIRRGERWEGEVEILDGHAEIIRDVLAAWEPSGPGREAADEAVRGYLTATLAEYEAWREGRPA